MGSPAWLRVFVSCCNSDTVFSVYLTLLCGELLFFMNPVSSPLVNLAGKRLSFKVNCAFVCLCVCVRPQYWMQSSFLSRQVAVKMTTLAEETISHRCDDSRAVGHSRSVIDSLGCVCVWCIGLLHLEQCVELLVSLSNQVCGATPQHARPSPPLPSSSRLPPTKANATCYSLHLFFKSDIFIYRI